MNVRPVPFLISQYAWLIILGTMLLSITPYKIPSRTKRFTSYQSELPFDSTKTPIWFLHVSDLHLSSVRKGSYEKIKKIFVDSISIFKPEKIIIAGDLTDNYSPEKNFHYQAQMKEDWDLYPKLINELQIKDKILHCVGNHDMFRIKSFNSMSHYGKDLIYSSDNFLVSKSYYENEGFSIKFIIVNPYNFPATPICFGQFAYPENEVYDQINKELSLVDTNFTMILSHHPVLRWSTWQKVSSMINKAYNLRFFITGHWHPKGTFRYHIGDTYEVVGAAIFKARKIGIFTIDNRRSAYHFIDLDKPPFILMTSPVPSNQTSSLDIFNQNDFEVRALAFTKEAPKLKVSGAATGELKCKSIQEGVFLCSLPVHIPNGKHRLFKEGDWDGYVDFVVGQTTDPFLQYPYITRPNMGWAYVFIPSIIAAMYLVLPGKKSGVVFSYEQWIQGKRDRPSIFVIVFSSIEVLRYRVNLLPQWMRALLTCSVFATVFIPISFFKIEDLLCSFWCWGYHYTGRFVFHYLGPMMACCYLYFVVFPILILLTSFQVTFERTWTFGIDIILFLVSSYGIYYSFWWTRDMFGPYCVLTCPHFIYIPLILYSTTVWWMFNSGKQEKLSGSTDSIMFEL